MVSPSDAKDIGATQQAHGRSASGLACVDVGTCTALTGYTPLFAIFAPQNHPQSENLIHRAKERIAPILEFMDTPRALLEALVLRPMILDPLGWHPVIQGTVKASWFTHPMNLLAFRALAMSPDFCEWRKILREDYTAVRQERMENVYLGSWEDLCCPDEDMALQVLWEMAERGKRVEELDLGSLHPIRD